ncbi:MAG: hypothetical protein P1V81_08540 [Planctomycetota bacterium]|nr:hypothetical protein [Planctomycetota bacterium]
MGKKSQHSRHRSDSDESFDFYQRLEESEASWDEYGRGRTSARSGSRPHRKEDDPFGERQRRRNRRRGSRRSPGRGERRSHEQWDEAG